MSQNLIEDAKRMAAYAAVDEYVKSGMVLGIGSGSTVLYKCDAIIRDSKPKRKIKNIIEVFYSAIFTLLIH